MQEVAQAIQHSQPLGSSLREYHKDVEPWIESVDQAPHTHEPCLASSTEDRSELRLAMAHRLSLDMLSQHFQHKSVHNKAQTNNKWIYSRLYLKTA